jgi:hypothetical protein
MFQQVPPDPPHYDPDHRLTYAELRVYLKSKYNIKIPQGSLYSMKSRGQLPEQRCFARSQCGPSET